MVAELMARSFLAKSLGRRWEDAEQLPTLLWWPEALLLRAFWVVCARLSPEQASDLGAGLLQRLGPRLAKHRQVLANLAVVLGPERATELPMIARQSWANLGRVLAEYPHLKTIGTDPERLMIAVDPAVACAVSPCPPAIYVGAHLGNWELASLGMVRRGAPVSIVYSALQNPHLDQLLQQQRRVPGCTFVARQAPLRTLFRELHAGRSLGFVMDLRVDNGADLPLFGVAASTTLAPARLALRFGCPLVPVRMERLPGVRFRMTFEAPIPIPDHGDDDSRARAMTTAVNARFETWIAARPGQWHCTKRRFPKHKSPH